MNKEQYIEELKQRLNGMDDCDIKDAIDYCEEYFDEAGEGNEQEVINDLGTPAKFAAQIRAESTIRRASSKTRKSNQRTTANSSLKNLGIILVGVCALPIALPLLSISCIDICVDCDITSLGICRCCCVCCHNIWWYTTYYFRYIEFFKSRECLYVNRRRMSKHRCRTIIHHIDLYIDQSIDPTLYTSCGKNL